MSLVSFVHVLAQIDQRKEASKQGRGRDSEMEDVTNEIGGIK